MKRGIIYKWTNTVNGKCYIGQTKWPQKRYHNHLREAFKNNSPYAFHRALRKYGTASFDYEILEWVPVDELNEREQYWISFYNSYGMGYNETIGGDGVSGYKMSQITKDKIRKTVKKSCAYMRKKVYQYSLDGELLHIWDSTMDCERGGHCESKVCQCCLGQRKTHHNFVWSYIPLERIAAQRHGKSKTVYQYNLDGKLINIWDSLTECGNSGYSTGCISQCCTGKKDTYLHYIWSYYPIE